MGAMLEMVEGGKPEDDAPALATFDDFWLLYPRHVAKKDARKVWDRLTPAQHLQALVALFDWRGVWEHEAKEREDRHDFLPYPSSWLNGERWEDELPRKFAQKPHAAHQAVKLPEPGKPAPMPDHVRALLAKLRK